MDLNKMLGIDPDDPDEQHIRALVEADESLLSALVRLRQESGLSQKDVAEKLGVSQSAIAHIESGDRDPHLSTLRRYAFAVGALVTHEVKPVQTSRESWARVVELATWKNQQQDVAWRPVQWVVDYTVRSGEMQTPGR